MAFVNHNTKEIVIATAGTKPSDAMDLLDDLGLLFGLVPSKMSSITSFLHRIKEELGDDFKNYETITTGHSLGSTLSDLTAVKAKDIAEEEGKMALQLIESAAPSASQAGATASIGQNINIKAGNQMAMETLKTSKDELFVLFSHIFLNKRCMTELCYDNINVSSFNIKNHNVNM